MTRARRLGAVLAAALLTTSLLVGFTGLATAVTPVTDCTAINSPGHYVLQNDVAAGPADIGCINILSDDVVFDGAGYTISAANLGNDFGIVVNSADNVSISDVTVVNFSLSGISVTAVTAIWLSGVTVAESGNSPGFGTGLAAQQVDGLWISDSEFVNNSFSGIDIEFATNVWITDSQAHNNTNDGLDMRSVSNISVEWSVFNTNGNSGMDLRAISNATFKYNVISFNEGGGVVIFNFGPVNPGADPGSDNVTFCCNEVANNGASGFDVRDVKDLRIAYTLITENTLGSGIELDDPFRNVTIEHSVIAENDQDGIRVTGPRPSGLANPFLIDGPVDAQPANFVDLSNADGLTLTNNLVKANGFGSRFPQDGLDVARVKNVSSEGNVYIGNAIDGVRLLDVVNANFTKEIVTRNGDDGFDIEGESTVYVTYSRITDNGQNASFEGSGITVFGGITAGYSTVHIHRNVIAGNPDFGVHNQDSIIGTNFVHATNNSWGAADGPGSSASPNAPFADPVTGTLANGGGDNVSESAANPGISNVRFDPFLTRGPDMVPSLPDSKNFQVDLAVGLPLCKVGPGAHAGFYSDDDRLVRFFHGSTEIGEVRQGSTTILPEYAGCLEDVSLSYDEANATVTATFTVKAGCELPITLSSYEKPNFVFSRADTQIRYDSQTMVFGPGTHSLTVDLPDETA